MADPIAGLLLLEAARRGLKRAREMQSWRDEVIGDGLDIFGIRDDALGDDIDFIDCAIDAYERAAKDPTDDH